MGKTIEVYLSNPYGFWEAGRFFMYKKLIPSLKQIENLKINNPWDFTINEKELVSKDELRQIEKIAEYEKRREAWQKKNGEIYALNKEKIKECNLMIAILDGVDVDSGVAWEMGYRRGLDENSRIKVPIIGYRSDFRMAGENIGTKVNLQVGESIFDSGGVYVENLKELKKVTSDYVQRLLK